jgi:hypothetical protein
VLAKIAGLVFQDRDARLRRTAIAASVLIGITGVAGVATLGNTMNEWPGAALVLIAFALLLRDAVAGRVRVGTAAIAGLLAGLACGLKLTAATSAVALAAALAARRPFPDALRDAFVFGLAVLAGLAIAAGPWMLTMNELYGSPLFPYFNPLFRSPLMPFEAIRDVRFGPRSLVQWLTLPFDLYAPPTAYVSEIAHRDGRFPLLTILAFAALAWAAVRPRGASSPLSAASRTARRFLAVYVVVAFVVWAAMHAYYRYLLPLELLSGAAIAGLALALSPRRVAPGVLVALTIVLVASTRYPDWGRVPFGPAFLDVRRPAVEPNALVLLTADAPLAYVLTRFPSDARHLGAHNNLVRADRPSGLRERIAAIVAAHEGPIYQLTVRAEPAARELAAYGLRRRETPCAEITTNLQREPILLCRLERGAGR